jgi:hypothetical protein
METFLVTMVSVGKDNVELAKMGIGSHLELERQWKVTIFNTICVKRRVRIFNTKNLYGNDT